MRETCSLTIGIISLKLTLHQLELLLRIVDNLTKNTDSWEIFHSGILILRTTLEKNDSCLECVLNLTYENMKNCIINSDDDVRQVSSQSLIPICERLNDILASDNECVLLIKI